MPRPGHSPYAALRQWINLFVDFLATKHGLAASMQPGDANYQALHPSFLNRLVPVCAALLEATVEADEIHPEIEASARMRGVAACVSVPSTPTTRPVVWLTCSSSDCAKWKRRPV
ncbi:hypothetical protein DAETH_32700 (plasmid) [Deinococcus aetherius]|uniref:Transcriptional regulator SbtR-like C-terminal domain-containing protein n=1 Tax=Deinococcus aetherius TaxID=200252 RepID=A0ABN6RNF9_9DEIO|nr:hypothetical protein DAETH_32700 [Deinococcus aetherius]